MENAAVYFYPRPPRGGRHSSETIRCSRRYFYPRPPRGGRRQRCGQIHRKLRFLSTPSARRATITHLFIHASSVISIHALREEGDPTSISGPTLHQVISIHALREEGDRNSYMFTRFLRDFYPRPPRGGRPEGVTREYFVHIISIHALREEGDMRTVYRVQTAQTFLSTPSARRATRHLFQALHCTR